MTTTKRVLVEFQDCLALQMTCTCGASVTLPFSASTETVPCKCSICDKDWFAERKTEREQFSRIFSSIKAVKKLKEFEDTKCKFHLEINPAE